MDLTTKQSLVYVIQAQGTSLCKLGVTTDVKARFRTIQTGCPHKCIILATWPGSKRLETKLHNHFAEYRREGEWFELPPFCGKQIWDIVRSHDTAGLVVPRRKAASVKRSRRIVRVSQEQRLEMGRVYESTDPALWNLSVYRDRHGVSRVQRILRFVSGVRLEMGRLTPEIEAEITSRRGRGRDFMGREDAGILRAEAMRIKELFSQIKARP